jgi:hypothetical protein
MAGIHPGQVLRLTWSTFWRCLVYTDRGPGARFIFRQPSNKEEPVGVEASMVDPIIEVSIQSHRWQYTPSMSADLVV